MKVAQRVDRGISGPQQPQGFSGKAISCRNELGLVRRKPLEASAYDARQYNFILGGPEQE